MSAPVDVVAVLPSIERKVVRHLNAVRGRMLAEGAVSDSDDEIFRCLHGCVCGPYLIEIATYARDRGLKLSGESAAFSLSANEAKAVRFMPMGDRIIAADALDVFSAALDERRARSSNPSELEGAVAPHHESAQTMAHGSSAGGVSTQLPLFAALRAVGGAE